MRDQNELSLEEAAVLLNVSLPFLTGLAEKGVLPIHVRETNRTVRLADVLAHKRQAEVAGEMALRELAALSQELNMGY